MQNVIISNAKRKMRLDRAIEWFNNSNIVAYIAERNSDRGVSEIIYLLQDGFSIIAPIGSSIKYSNFTGKKLSGEGTLTILNIINVTQLNISPYISVDNEVLPVYVLIK